MGGAMFYPRTSVLPTIKTSLPSSINCLTDHRLDDGHQSRFHEHNHCWLHRLCRQKREEIYLFDEKPPLLLRSGGYCPSGGLRTIVHAAQFPIFSRRISAFSATAQHEKNCHQPEESVEKFCFVGRCRKSEPPMPGSRASAGWQPPYYYYHVPHILRPANKCPAINTQGTNCREKRRAAAQTVPRTTARIFYARERGIRARGKLQSK